jgi:Protein of unknown function (DUF732)
MKKLAIATGVLAMGLSLGFAPIASATEAEYVAALAAAGMSGSSAVQLGYAVCADISKGTSEADTVNSIYQNTANNITQKDAQTIFDLANAHLCAG